MRWPCVPLLPGKLSDRLHAAGKLLKTADCRLLQFTAHGEVGEPSRFGQQCVRFPPQFIRVVTQGYLTSWRP